MCGEIEEEDGEERGDVKDDKRKLAMLLVYWVEHNREHARDFKRWAEKARAFGEEGMHIYEAIMEAVKHTGEVNEYLLKAFELISNNKQKK
ncbi:MAG: hypothetical protein J7I99_02145 [Methanophagales archaeon]|nr:hypothetical protein [Methanophagales archaeon]